VPTASPCHPCARYGCGAEIDGTGIAGALDVIDLVPAEHVAARIDDSYVQARALAEVARAAAGSDNSRAAAIALRADRAAAEVGNEDRRIRVQAEMADLTAIRSNLNMIT
jgi:hypothetical protein